MVQLNGQMIFTGQVNLSIAAGTARHHRDPTLGGSPPARCGLVARPVSTAG